ncbi:YceD family protein [Novosphingobium lentum]|uniref:YceD family protein n=1 Tax=Novosphingobium lentum TaxID=145287 RepID=UPI00083474B2|nr:DUF177 domain-containing protein [Novosphingobium lentum]
MTSTPPPEYSLVVDARHIPERPVHLEPDEAQRRRLAARFGLSAIVRMVADLQLDRDGTALLATGRLIADVVQPCAISGEDFAVSIDQPVTLRFVPATTRHRPGEEIELDANDCDEIEYDGSTVDLGEELAQTLAMAIDPFAEGPQADAFRKAHGLGTVATSGPFAALAALKRDTATDS